MALLQQLFSAFKGGGENRVPLALGSMQGWMPAFAETGGPQPYQYERAVRDGFLSNPIAQRAVRIVSEGVGQAPITSDNEKLSALVTATSAGQSLVETLAAHLLLHGNGYVQIIKDGAGNPCELYALRPDRMAVVAGSDGWPCAFTYSTLGDQITLPIEDEEGWPNVIQIKVMHPLDDYLGASSLAAAMQATAIHNAASEWNRALLENAARPSGALVYEPSDGAGLTQEQFERLKCELEAAFTGSGNAGRPMLLDGGLRWQSMAMSPADMDFATLKSAAAREIALSFGVP
ncbi:MAG: phage portal protein, partial [Pseudomonadota bacterium]